VNTLTRKPPVYDATGFDGWPIYIRLQPEAAERLVFAAGFPLFPAPGWMVQVRNSLPCPACGKGRLALNWGRERSGVLLAGSSCFRHVFVVTPPNWLTPGSAG
jgi:hypothetical protein